MYFSTTVAVALTSFLGAVTAQTYYPANPEDIDLGTKSAWCQNQISSCGLLCLDQQSGGGFTNDCDPETLQFQCICADNKVPNATEYSQTIPYFLCTYQVENCVQNCGQYDPTCAEACRTGRVCGATNPTRNTRTSTEKLEDKTSTGSRPTPTNGDDVAFDATPTGNSGSKTTGSSDDDDDAPAETGSNAKPQTDDGDKPNAATKLGSGYTYSVLLLSVLCGAFVFQL